MSWVWVHAGWRILWVRWGGWFDSYGALVACALCREVACPRESYGVFGEESVNIHYGVDVAIARK